MNEKITYYQKELHFDEVEWFVADIDVGCLAYLQVLTEIDGRRRKSPNPKEIKIHASVDYDMIFEAAAEFENPN